MGKQKKKKCKLALISRSTDGNETWVVLYVDDLPIASHDELIAAFAAAIP